AGRQLMVALAANQDRVALWRAYERLRAHGVELGDLALASGGVASVPTDAAFAAAIAPFADRPLARYLVAGRAYRNSHLPARLSPAQRDGFLGALGSLRAATAYAADGRGKDAASEIVAIGERALELRAIGAAALTEHWDVDPADAVRAWDAAAAGEYRNVARAAAALTLYHRGQVDAAADRAVALLDDLDLRAVPPSLNTLAASFSWSRRGDAGWRTAWATWRDRVLAGGSYDHVMAALANSQGAEAMP